MGENENGGMNDEAQRGFSHEQLMQIMQMLEQLMEKSKNGGLNAEALSGFSSEQIMQIMKMLQRLIVKGASDSNPGLLVVKGQIQLLAWSLTTSIDTLSAVQGALQCGLDRLQKMQMFDDIGHDDGGASEW